MFSILFSGILPLFSVNDAFARKTDENVVTIKSKNITQEYIDVESSRVGAFDISQYRKDLYIERLEKQFQEIVDGPKLSLNL